MGDNVTEDVNVVIVGAGPAGLATALALLRTNKRLKVKVFEKREEPKFRRGGACRLEPNGLKAAHAISPRLHRRILDNGLHAKTILMHDTDAGTVITRLNESSSTKPHGGRTSIVIGWYELEQVLLDLLPDDIVEWDTDFVRYEEEEDHVLVTFDGLPGKVRADFVVACDGPHSRVREQCTRDGPPVFDANIMWVGRLPGDDLSTTPLDYDAWWLKPGQAFTSHPLRDGDVAWEGMVATSVLAEYGYKWDEQLQEIVYDSPGDDHSGVRDTSKSHLEVRISPRTGTAIASTGGGGGDGGEIGAGGGGSGVPSRADSGPVLLTDWGAADAALAAGGRSAEEAAGGGGGAGSSSAREQNGVGLAIRVDPQRAASGGSSHVAAAGGRVAKSPLEIAQDLFSEFPKPVESMLASTRDKTVYMQPIFIRRPRELPASMGAGRVVILGEAAHPLRRTGQDENQALEDAVELGIAVMDFGLTKEALRRFEQTRRPRWRHVMQITMAQASSSNVGMGVRQGFLDYTSDLYRKDFTKLTQHRTRHDALWYKAARLSGTVLFFGSLISAFIGARRLRQEGHLKNVQPRDVWNAVTESVGGAVQKERQVAGQLGDEAASAAEAATKKGPIKRLKGFFIRKAVHASGSIVHTVASSATENAKSNIGQKLGAF